MKNELQQDVVPVWEKANIVMEMEIIAELAEKMITLGNEYNLPAFTHYAEPLLENSQIFNIADIQKALKELPILLKPLMRDEESSNPFWSYSVFAFNALPLQKRFIFNDE